MPALSVAVATAGSSARRTADKARLFLNSKANYRDEDNFTVMLTGKALSGGYQDVEAEAFNGKTVRVRGKVDLFQSRAQIVVREERQLELVEKK